MKFKTAICDDESIGIKTICSLLETYHFETGVEFEKHLYTDPLQLINDYKDSGGYDIIFLDVEMPVSDAISSGMDVARIIRSIPDNDVRIVFISNYPSYMQQGYDVQASYYLEKDVTTDKFIRVLNSIIVNLETDNSMFRIKTDRNQWDLIKTHEILYVKSFSWQRDMVKYITTSGEYTEAGRAITAIGNDLIPRGFAFANKHHLVNMHHVMQFTKECLQLDNKEYIEISRHYRKEFFDQFSQNIINL